MSVSYTHLTLPTSDSVDLGGRRIIKKKKKSDIRSRASMNNNNKKRMTRSQLETQSAQEQDDNE